MSINIIIGNDEIPIKLGRYSTIQELIDKAASKYSARFKRNIKIMCLQKEDGSAYPVDAAPDRCFHANDSVRAVWNALDSPTASSSSPSSKGGRRRRDRDSHGGGAANREALTGKISLKVFIPSINSTVNFIFKRNVSVGRACQLIRDNLNHTHLDITAEFGMSPSTARLGTGAAFNKEVLLGNVVKEGDTVCVGPILDNEAPDSFYLQPQFASLAGTKWDNVDWAVPSKDLSDPVLKVLVPEQGDVRKAARFARTDTVAKALEEFGDKCGVSAAQIGSYAFFYTIHGLSKEYEVEMNRGRYIGDYVDNLAMASVEFRRRDSAAAAK